MLSKANARTKVAALLPEWGRRIKGGLELVDEQTLDKPYGWVFFYDSRRSRGAADAIATNSPVVVLAATGEVVKLSTTRALDEELARFEKARGLRPG